MNVELPQVTIRRVDMLGASPDGELVAIEFQSRNEKRFPFRLGEYAFGLARLHGHVPCQIVLYVGRAGMNMKPSDSLIDIRDLDGEALLASPNLSDNLIAILTKLGGEKRTVARILSRITAGPVEMREQAVAELMILACLRGLEGQVQREVKRMPIAESIMDSPVLGPMIRKSLAQSRAEGNLEILMALMERRFGVIPHDVRERMAGLSSKQLRNASLRLLDAKRVSDVFPR
jgi:hypothetical protein